MFTFGLIALACLVGAYFTRGINRIMLILLAVAIIELKSIAIGAKIFSFTIMIVAALYFLSRSNKKR